MKLLFLAAFAVVALIAPAGAGAATVVNGDFEAGSLTGWTVQNNPATPTTGDWYAYTGTTAPLGFEEGPPPGGEGPQVQAPPQGNWAAITSQGGPGTHILYQEVTLEPGYSHALSMLVYYHTEAPVSVPSPNTLDYNAGPSGEGEGEVMIAALEEEERKPSGNQQYRVDVMRPTAPLESLDSADILATAFATKNGDPRELGPTPITVDLSPFAGQTVRLRFAEVDSRGNFWAGADAVSITSTPPPPPPPSNAFMIGKPKLNMKKGTAKLPVTLPGPGVLGLADVRASKKLIKAATLTATGPATLKVPIRPTKRARKALKADGKKVVKAVLTFTPTGGMASSQTRKLTLRLKLHEKHRNG